MVCLAEIGGKTYGFPFRAPAYPSNSFEYPVHPTDENYTFFLPLKKEWEGREITLKALFAADRVPTDVYLCDGHQERKGVEISLR